MMVRSFMMVSNIEISFYRLYTCFLFNWFFVRYFPEVNRWRFEVRNPFVWSRYPGMCCSCAIDRGCLDLAGYYNCLRDHVMEWCDDCDNLKRRGEVCLR